MADQLYSTLPRYLQRRIDSTFDRFHTTTKSTSPYTVGCSFDTGGGFIVEDLDDSSHTLAEGATSADGQLTIPIYSIPTALKLLKLPYDDEKILSVFQTAAFGWANSTLPSGLDDVTSGSGRIYREDWRSICAVLLENRVADEEKSKISEEPLGENSDSYSFGDDQCDFSEGFDDSTDGDYVDSYTSPSNARRRTRDCPNLIDAPSQRPLNRQQQEVILDAFSLFFPSVPRASLKEQKIMLKDIQWATKLIGEKIKYDEMLEMLEFFSTTSDQFIGLSDFGRIMVAARLS